MEIMVGASIINFRCGFDGSAGWLVGRASGGTTVHDQIAGIKAK
jgi:hypothetical protein